MDNLFHFKSKNDLGAEENLRDFIDQCKNKLTVFGKDLKWNEWRWPKAATFTKLGANSRTQDEADKLDDEFIGFAKAYFRYKQGQKPTGTKNELKALRAVEAALLQVNHNAKIEYLSMSVLDEAALIIRQHYSVAAAYQGGRELEVLAKFVSDKRLISGYVGSWKSPLQRGNDRVQTGSKAKQRREKMLPSEEALNAMAEIFSNDPQEPKDIFTSSTFTMTMCAPVRISEILILPVDCEVEQTDSKGVVRYGWRFYSGKGFGADIKWIPTEMVSVAKQAVERIKRLTETARKLAKHMEDNPGQFYHHADCPSVTDDSFLSMQQAAQALDGKRASIKDIRNTLHNAKLVCRDDHHTLNSLWQYVMTRQPEGFPWLNKEVKIRYSNALFCMTKNLLHDDKVTSPVILWTPTNNVFNNDVSPRKSLKSVHLSIFDRWGYKTSDGRQLKLTSHQARHLLNTIVQRGGLSQLQIAKWSGRANVKQNRTYNHVSEYEMVARVQELDTSLALFGPSGGVNENLPITIQEFNIFEKGAVHITEFGVCIHDFVMSPCDKYRDCLNCNEQVCIKGKKENLKEIKFKYDEVKLQFEAAKRALDDGLAGTDRWYEVHEISLRRLEQLVSILEDPGIPDGSLIKLKNDKAFSPLNRAIESKLPKASKKEMDMLETMSNLLGGSHG